jgi:AAA domain/Bifunctional DNA primase/polymerase, N-terminal/Primase C terminal 1 (PriCT-1)
MRPDDQRSDELLEECGRIAVRLGLAIGWTSGIRGAKAKAASDRGSGAWKRAAPLIDEEYAAGHFKVRCRTRNPIVTAMASNLILIEIDGDDTLADEYGLPETVSARSRRGLHRYYRPAEGCAPAKFQIDPDGVTHSTDGYLVLPPALHETGVVYEWVSNGSPAELPADVYTALRQKADETERRVEETLAEGAKIAEGQRDNFIFSRALDLAHNGMTAEEILPSMLELARSRCEPPLGEEHVRRQVQGAVKRARQKPSAGKKLALEAEAALAKLVESPPPTGIVSARKRRHLGFVGSETQLPEPLRFLIPGLVPLGVPTLLAGVGGLGKSSWACRLSATLSRGEHDIDGAVLYISFEDPARSVLRPRLEVAGADLARVYLLEEGSELPVLPNDLAEIRDFVTERAVRLLVIDPVSASLSLKLDAHRDQDVRVVLGQLAALARELELALILIGHLNKAPSRDAYIRISGSPAFYNAARSVITITLDPDDPDHRLVAQHKANLARLVPVQRHRIEGVTYEYGGQTISTSRMVFVEDADDVDPYAVLEQFASAAPTKRDDAGTLILAALCDGDWHELAVIEGLTTARGISRRTLYRAAETLGVESEMRGFPGKAWWRLPGAPTPGAHLDGTPGQPA